MNTSMIATQNESTTVSGAPLMFRYRTNIGKVRHLVSHHDGQKVHRDGSPFFDASLFGRKRDAEKFIRSLKVAGYIEQ